MPVKIRAISGHFLGKRPPEKRFSRSGVPRKGRRERCRGHAVRRQAGCQLPLRGDGNRLFRVTAAKALDRGRAVGKKCPIEP